MGNDEIEMDAFTILQDMALSDDLKVIISRFSDLLRELGVRHKLTPQELAALIHLANERLSVKTSMMFYSYLDTFMSEDPEEQDSSGSNEGGRPIPLPGFGLLPPDKPGVIPKKYSDEMSDEESDFYKAQMERCYGIRICPECGHENRHPGKYCDDCKQHLRPFIGPIEKIPLKWCRNCRHVNPSGVTKCEECGYDLSTGEPPHRMNNLIGDLLVKMDRIPKDAMVLRFFLEHPFHTFDVSQIARYLGIPRDVVKTNLDKFVDLGYILGMEEKGLYKLKCSKEILQILIECLTRLPDIWTEEDSVGDDGIMDAGDETLLPEEPREGE